MQVSLDFPAADIRERVHTARRRADAAPRELYPLLAVELEELERESFLRRSSGSPDAGITWEPLTPHTLEDKRSHGYPAAIGIADGTLLGSLQSESTPDGFEVRFTARFAPLFDAQRQLLPGDLPEDWRRRLETTAEDWLDDLLTFE